LHIKLLFAAILTLLASILNFNMTYISLAAWLHVINNSLTHKQSVLAPPKKKWKEL